MRESAVELPEEEGVETPNLELVEPEQSQTDPHQEAWRKAVARGKADAARREAEEKASSGGEGA